MAVGLMALAAVVVLLTFDPRVERGGDNALYWALARSIADGEGYRNLVMPGSPPETSVPWGYPALLAVPIALGATYVQAKLLSAVCMVGAVGCYWGMVRRMLPGHQGLAVIIGLLVVLDERILGFGSSILSEAPYLLLSMATLWVFDASQQAGKTLWGAPPPQSVEAPQGVLPGMGAAAIAALFAGCAYLVRPAGVSLVLALLLLLAATRRWRDLGAAIAVLALVVGSWHVWALITPSTEENLYLGYLLKQSKFQADDAQIGPLGMAVRVATNAAAYTTEIMPRFVYGLRWPKEGLGPLVPPFLVALAIGWWSGLRSPRLIHVYLPLYAGVLVAWLPESVNARYFAIGFPLMVALALPGLWQLTARWSKPVAAWVTLITAVVLISARVDHLAGAVIDAHEVRTAVASGDELADTAEEHRSFVGMVKWLATSAEPGAIIAARKPRITWYYSGHQTLRLPEGDDPDILMAWLDENHVDYVVIDRIDEIAGENPATKDRLRPLRVEQHDRFEVVRRGSHGDRVLRILAPQAEEHPVGEALPG